MCAWLFPFFLSSLPPLLPSSLEFSFNCKVATQSSLLLHAPFSNLILRLLQTRSGVYFSMPWIWAGDLLFPMDITKHNSSRVFKRTCMLDFGLFCYIWNSETNQWTKLSQIGELPQTGTAQNCDQINTLLFWVIKLKYPSFFLYFSFFFSYIVYTSVLIYFLSILL